MDFSTLYTRLGRRRGFDGNTARLKGFVNDAIQEIVGRRSDWEWLRGQHQFQTRAPITSSTATFTNDSYTVGIGSAATVTLAGALSSSPDDALYRITLGNSTGSSFTIPVKYPGATVSGSAALKVYFDTYPLPAGCTQIERLVVTGNGWQTPIPQESLLPSGMAVLTFNDTETYPRAYALDSSVQLETPRLGPTVAAAAGTGLTGVYSFAYAYLNDATGEVGPLSPTASVTLTNEDVDITGIRTRGGLRRRLYRTEAGGSDLLWLKDLDSSSGSELAESTADSALGFDTVSDKFIGGHPGHASTTRVRLWPPPDEEYLVSLTYFAGQKDLVLDNEVPLLPSRYHHLILTLAESLALSEEENHRAAAQKRQIAMEGVDQMAMEQDMDPNRIAGVGRGATASRRLELHDGRWPRFVDQ